jgi:tryptophanyl-tRNA synthetase
MFTDPNHLRVEDPGRVEGNVVFAHLRAFDADLATITDLEERYRRGGLGDSTVKRRLEDILQTLIAPIRERRLTFAGDRGAVEKILERGTARARETAGHVLADVRSVFALDRRHPVGQSHRRELAQRRDSTM